MRIIAGKYKGRQLVNFKADHIRPTTDRIKESIFNKLMFSIEDAMVLDLFSGTGNLTFEALSRGAQKVVSVELNKKSIGIMKKNKEMLKIQEEMEIVPSDVLKYLKSYGESPFDIVLIDPPFTKKMAHEVMEAVAQSKVFHPDTVFVIESSKQERIDDDYGQLGLDYRKNYGDKNVSIFNVKA